MTVPQQKASRKARFKAALAFARITAKEWCEVNDIGETQLYAVLSGTRESVSLTARIDAFIEVHLGSQIGSVAR